MRQAFFKALHVEMAKDERIWLLTGDLGFGGFNAIESQFPDRFINYGAAEFGMVGTACGLALSGKIPIVYSITPFVLYRPFEFLRTYLNHEEIPVKLVGSGRDEDYQKEGVSHWAKDASGILSQLPNIRQFWPIDSDHFLEMFDLFLYSKEPSFLSLKK
jgi:transketolase